VHWKQAGSTSTACNPTGCRKRDSPAVRHRQGYSPLSTQTTPVHHTATDTVVHHTANKEVVRHTATRGVVHRTATKAVVHHTAILT